MAATYAPASVDRPIIAQGGGYELIGTITFSGNYSSGGDAVDFTAILKQQGVGVVDKVILNSRDGYTFEYDYTNSKVKVYQQKDPANAGGADIPGPELPAAAYPAAITARASRVVVKGR